MTEPQEYIPDDVEPEFANILAEIDHELGDVYVQDDGYKKLYSPEMVLYAKIHPERTSEVLERRQEVIKMLMIQIDGENANTVEDTWIALHERLMLSERFHNPEHPEYTPVIFTIAEAKMMANENIPYYLEGLIGPGQVTLLSGREKLGKSTLLTAMLAHIERGEEFCGMPVHEPAKAVWYTEESVATLYQKAEAFELSESGIVLIQYSRIPGRNTWDQTIDGAVNAAKQHNAKIVVIDTLRQWSDISNENDNAEMAGTARRFSEKIKRENLAGVLIHHHSKAGGSNLDATRGGTALAGAVDIVASLFGCGKKKPTQRRLEAQGRDVRSNFQRRFDLHTEEPEVEGGLGKQWYEELPDIDDDEQLDETEEQYWLDLIKELQGDEGATPKMLSDASGKVVNTVKGKLAILEEAGLVKKTPARGPKPARYKVKTIADHATEHGG